MRPTQGVVKATVVRRLVGHARRGDLRLVRASPSIHAVVQDTFVQRHLTSSRTLRVVREEAFDVASCDSRMNSNGVVLTSPGQFKFT
jgi:hypothetical protein